MDIKKFYNKKLEQFGENDFRSLNWSDEEGKSAKKRYKQMSQYVDFKCKNYIGYDINENLIALAKKKYPKHNWIYDLNKFKSKPYDLCISSGVAGNRGGPACKHNNLFTWLSLLSSISNKVLINFPSNRATIRSANVEYFSPEYVLGQALNITENVQIIHKQKADFLLILTHE